MLTEDEKDLGVVSMTSVVVQPILRSLLMAQPAHCGYSIAGDQVTNDIAMALRTPTPNAEDIKIKYGCALTSLAGETRPSRWRALVVGRTGTFLSVPADVMSPDTTNYLL